MKFSTRNAFYLRASNYRVIPLFLYLDERHVDWMEDSVLQRVIAELQPKMPELLFQGKGEKKHKVYVERGEGYQYCYFLRTTTRTEVVLLKQKTFSLRPPTPPRRTSTPLLEGSASSSKRRRTSRSTRSKSRSRSVSVLNGLGNDADMENVKDEPPPSPGLTQRDDDEDEPVNIKDWKPDVDVSYKGFGTSSVQLVLIIEPYPPLPPSQYAPPSSRLSTRSASIATSRSRSRQVGTGLPRGSRYSSSSTSLSVRPDDRTEAQTPSANMRNPTRSASSASTPVPNSRRGGSRVPGVDSTSSTPFDRGDRESTGGSVRGGLGERNQTPLFIPRDTPFDEDDEDVEAHEEYTAALREGRLRLPSLSRPAGTPAPDDRVRSSGRRSVRRTIDDDDEDEDDVPESLGAISERLVRSSEIEERIVRVQGGWEERGEGEESAVMGREEPGD